MAQSETHDITRLLHRWQKGDEDAEGQLVPRIYGELHRIAASYMHRERADHTLQPTALIHEAFLRLQTREGLHWNDRHHFFGFAAHQMRRVLVDHARSHQRQKRGGDRTRITFMEGRWGDHDGSVELLDLDAALEELAELDPERARIVELRFFGGLTHGEIAALMGVTERTVKRRWQRAKAWLYDRMTT